MTTRLIVGNGPQYSELYKGPVRDHPMGNATLPALPKGEIVTSVVRTVTVTVTSGPNAAKWLVDGLFGIYRNGGATTGGQLVWQVVPIPRDGQSISQTFSYATGSSVAAEPFFANWGGKHDLPMGVSIDYRASISTGLQIATIAPLRSSIDALRRDVGLPPSRWTDTAVETPVRAAHVIELRASLVEVYARLGLPPAGYPSGPLAPNTVLGQAHVDEVAAALAKAQAASTQRLGTRVAALRSSIDTVRMDVGLSPYGWSDPRLQNPIRGAHVLEMRTAIAQLDARVAVPAPGYPSGALRSDSLIQPTHLDEIETALVAPRIALTRNVRTILQMGHWPSWPGGQYQYSPSVIDAANTDPFIEAFTQGVRTATRNQVPKWEAGVFAATIGAAAKLAQLSAPVTRAGLGLIAEGLKAGTIVARVAAVAAGVQITLTGVGLLALGVFTVVLYFKYIKPAFPVHPAPLNKYVPVQSWPRCNAVVQCSWQARGPRWGTASYGDEWNLVLAWPQ